jgi:hypothetical protein
MNYRSVDTKENQMLYGTVGTAIKEYKSKLSEIRNEVVEEIVSCNHMHITSRRWMTSA